MSMVKFGVKNKKMKPQDLPKATKQFIKTANAKLAKGKTNENTSSQPDSK